MSNTMLLRKILAETEAMEARDKNSPVIISIGRADIRKAVNKHSPILKQKFPKIDLEQVVLSTQLMLRDAIDKSLGRRDVQWINSRKTELVAGNSRKLGRLMTQVKTNIRQTARDSINTTRKKLKKKETNTVASSFVITGTDVRNKSKGGDIRVKTDLKKGVIVKSARDFNRETKHGIQVAQTFGPGIRDKDLLDLFKSDKVKKKLIKTKTEKIKREAQLKTSVGRLKDGKFGGARLVILQPKTTIASKAAFSTNVKKVISNHLTKGFKIQEIVDRTSKDIVEIFLGKRQRLSKGKKKTEKAQRTTTIKHPVYSFDLISTRYQDRGEEKQSYDFASILQIVNDRLHDAIRDNMGKGRSKSTLNYRTGRFARSAEALKLWESTEKRALNAHVKYMRYPYGTFEEGGAQGLPRGRWPNLIFGKAIRQILREQKIADLRRVKVKLSG